MDTTRISVKAASVLRDIAAEPQTGTQLAKSHRSSTPSMYQMLHRLEVNGLVRSEYQKNVDDDGHTTRVRPYRITAAGRQLLRKLNGK